VTDINKFRNPEYLVRMSPFLVASFVGKSDGIHLETEKLIDLFDFEDFSLQAKEFTVSSEIFLELENENYDYIWQLSIEELLSIIKDLPESANEILGKNMSKLSSMLEKVVLQVAKADGFIHDLEIGGAEELENIFNNMTTKLLTEQDKEKDRFYGYQIINIDEQDNL